MPLCFTHFGPATCAPRHGPNCLVPNMFHTTNQGTLRPPQCALVGGVEHNWDHAIGVFNIRVMGLTQYPRLTLISPLVFSQAICEWTGTIWSVCECFSIKVLNGRCCLRGGTVRIDGPRFLVGLLFLYTIHQSKVNNKPT